MSASKRNPRLKAVDTAALNAKALLTLEDAAFLLSFSKSTVESLITVQRRGTSPRLRTVREGRSVRITRIDLDKYVSRLRAESGIR